MGRSATWWGDEVMINEKDRALFKACGWTVRKTDVGYDVLKDDSLWFEAHKSEDDAWNIVEIAAPDYFNSVDAVLKLPWPSEDATGYYTRLINIAPDGTADVFLTRHENVLLNGDDHDQKTDWYGDGNTLARALCKCFVAWMEKK